MFKYGKKKPQGATRNTARASQTAAGGSSLPSWLLVGLGMGIGLFIAFMLYLWKPWQPVKRPEPQTPVAENSDTPPAEKNTGEPRFDFYRLLPNQKVIAEEPATGTTDPASATPPPPAAAKPASQPVSKPADAERLRAEAILEDRKPSTDKPKQDAKPAAKAVPAEKNPDKPKTSEKPDSKPLKPKETAKETAKAKEPEKNADTTRYTLQAGSFKSQAEAERRKAKVALSGLPARIQQVKVKEGEVWYRVIVGPFKGKQASDKAQGSLRGDGVDSLAIKEKK